MLHRLLRKYGGTLESVIAFGAKARIELDTISNATEKIGELETRETGLLKELSERCITLSEKRKASAAALARAV